MKTRTKSILALSGTLLIGMVIGALIAFQVVRNKIANFLELREKNGFTEHIIGAAEPSPEQEAQIRPILESFGESMEGIHRRHMKEIHEQMNALRDSMDLYLEPDQIQKVEQRLRRLKGRRGGPPGPKHLRRGTRHEHH